MLSALAIAVPVLALVWTALSYGGWPGPFDRLSPRALRRGRPGGYPPRVALTFDDGPHPVHTPALLDVLRAEGVRATFFLVGEKVRAHPELAARIAREGHEIGNHTDRHVYLPWRATHQVVREISRCDEAILEATGTVPVLFRPPWGGRTPRVLAELARAGKRLALWTYNPRDYLREAPEIAARVIDRAEPGLVVLLHEARDGGGETVEAVARIIPALANQGYRLTVVSRLEAEEAREHSGPALAPGSALAR